MVGRYEKAESLVDTNKILNGKELEIAKVITSLISYFPHYT